MGTFNIAYHNYDYEEKKWTIPILSFVLLLIFLGLEQLDFSK